MVILGTFGPEQIKYSQVHKLVSIEKERKKIPLLQDSRLELYCKKMKEVSHDYNFLFPGGRGPLPGAELPVVL